MGICFILVCFPSFGSAKDLQPVCSNPNLISTLDALEILTLKAKSLNLKNASREFYDALSICKPPRIPFGGDGGSENPEKSSLHNKEPIILDSSKRKDILEKAENFERAAQQLSPKYQTTGFQCLEEHGKCKAEGKIGYIGCGFGLVICWAPNIIPLTGSEK